MENKLKIKIFEDYKDPIEKAVDEFISRSDIQCVDIKLQFFGGLYRILVIYKLITVIPKVDKLI